MTETAKPWCCHMVLCGARFDTREEVQEHMKKEHPEWLERKTKLHTYTGRPKRTYNRRQPDTVEESDEDRNKKGPYPLPLDLISIYVNKDGESLRFKIQDEVWKFWPEPHWKRVTEHFIEFNRLNKQRNITKRFRITKIAIKMAKKIHKELGIKLFPITTRTYVGYWQKSLGAWLWCFYGEGMKDYGSSWPMGFLLQKKVSLWIVDDCIGPDELTSNDLEDGKNES